MSNHKKPLTQLREGETEPRVKVDYNCACCGCNSVRYVKTYHQHTFCHACDAKLVIEKTITPWRAEVLAAEVVEEFEVLFAQQVM